MIVERRYSKRYPVDFDVKFRYRDLYSCASHALDLSLQGMQLVTGSASPPTGGFVKILFSLGDRTWTIPAVVTHSTPGRIGVMFREAQPGLYQAMKPRSKPRYVTAAASSASH